MNMRSRSSSRPIRAHQSLRTATDPERETEVLLLRQKNLENNLLVGVLAEVNRLMTMGLSFEGFCLEVSHILQEKLNFKYIHIWIREEQDPELLRLVTPETVRGFRSVSIHTGVVGKCIREAACICIPDVSTDPDYNPVHPEVVSELCVPLVYEGAVIGALNIETGVAQDFSTQMPVINIIAENLSHSLKLALLYKTEEKFHRLVEQINEGVWVLDEGEHTLYANPTLLKMIGATDQEMRDKISYDFFDEKSKAVLAQESQKRHQGTRSHYEATLVSKSGERIPVLVHAVPFGKGGSMATITDLRPLKEAREKLAYAQRYLAAITQYSQEAIASFNDACVVQSWNIGAEQIFGFKAEEMIGKSVELIIPQERLAAGELQQLVKETKQRGCVRNFETVRIHKNGKPIQISLTMSALKNESGEIIGISVIDRDISAQKKWERELQDRFEKMQEAYREMGKQRRYLDYLIDMIQMSGAAHHTPKHIATFIVNAIVVITKVDAVTLRLIDRPTNKLQLAAQSGLGEEWWSKKSIGYSGSLLEKAVRHGGPLKVLDIVSDPLYTSPSLARKNNLRSALIIALQARGEVLGSLTLYLAHDGNLSMLDDEFIMVFAQQGAIALKLAS